MRHGRAPSITERVDPRSRGGSRQYGQLRTVGAASAVSFARPCYLSLPGTPRTRRPGISWTSFALVGPGSVAGRPRRPDRCASLDRDRPTDQVYENGGAPRSSTCRQIPPATRPTGERTTDGASVPRQDHQRARPGGDAFRGASADRAAAPTAAAATAPGDLNNFDFLFPDCSTTRRTCSQPRRHGRAAQGPRRHAWSTRTPRTRPNPRATPRSRPPTPISASSSTTTSRWSSARRRCRSSWIPRSSR